MIEIEFNDFINETYTFFEDIYQFNKNFRRKHFFIFFIFLVLFFNFFFFSIFIICWRNIYQFISRAFIKNFEFIWYEFSNKLRGNFLD